MLSKKRVKTKLRTKSNTRTKLNTRKLNNKKRVKRVSTKQRGGVKRRRTKKSKKKSQKGGWGERRRLKSKIKKLAISDSTKTYLKEMLKDNPDKVSEIIKKIQELEEISDFRKTYLLDMLKSPEKVEQVEKIIEKIQAGQSFVRAMAPKIFEKSDLATDIFFRLFGYKVEKEILEDIRTEVTFERAMEEFEEKVPNQTITPTNLTSGMDDLVTHVFFRLFGFNIDTSKLENAYLDFAVFGSDFDKYLLSDILDYKDQVKNGILIKIKNAIFSKIREAIQTYEEYTSSLSLKKKAGNLNKEEAKNYFNTNTGVTNESLKEFYYSETSADNMPINLAGLTSFDEFPTLIKDGLHKKIRELLNKCNDCEYTEDDKQPAEKGSICKEAWKKTGIPTFYALFFYKLLQQGVITKISA